jgi:hypothetical protein
MLLADRLDAADQLARAHARLRQAMLALPEFLSRKKEIPGRGERIRTSGLYVPNVALYQAKLHPDFFAETCAPA